MKLEGSSNYLIVIALLALLSTGLVSGQPDDIPRQDPSQVDIDPALQSSGDGYIKHFSGLFSGNREPQDVIVRLEDVNASEINDRKLKISKAQSPVLRLAKNNPNIEVKNKFWITNAVHLEVGRNVPLENIAGVKGVERMHHNFEVEALQPESQKASKSSVQASSGPSTYGLDKINATESWSEFGTRGESVKVSVLDTGIDISHPDIELYSDNASDPKYPGGWAEYKDGGVDSKPKVAECDGGDHGTHVSGTVSGGNESGTNIGVSPEVQLMNVGVLMKSSDDGCTGSFSDITNGIQWSVDNDADIISMSLGAEGYYSEFIEPIRNAQDNGVVMIAATGNSGTGTSIGPGNVYESFSVGAVNSTDDVTSFSSGEKVDTDTDWATDAPNDWPSEYIVPDISAPGANVISSVPESGSCNSHPCYASKFGTSMAAPHVSGAAALMESATEEDLDPNQIKEAFLETAWKPSEWGESDAPENISKTDSRYGKGIIDAYAATEYAITRFDKGYRIQNLSVNETKVNITDDFAVSGDIRNYESQNQSIDLQLKFNGSVDKNQTVNVGSKSSSRFEFVTNVSTEGLYGVAVNNESAGNIDVVMPPPKFSIGADLSDPEIVEGDSAVVSGTVDNSGGSGTADLKLHRNSTPINSTSLFIGFESSEAYSFNNTFSSPGSYELKVNNTTAGNLDVKNDAELSINNLSLNSSGNFFENETIEASITGQNVGDVAGNLTFELLIDGKSFGSETVEMNSGQNMTVEFTNSHPDRGNYTYSSGGLNKTLEVLQPGSIELIDSSLEDEMAEGDTYNYSVDLENPGDVEASSALEFSRNGTVYYNITSTVDSRSTESINSSQQIDAPGLYEISVNNSLNKTVDVLEEAELNQTEFNVEEEIVEGENISANTSVINIGEVEGNFTVPFNVSGPEEYNYSEEIILGPSNSITVNYSKQRDTPGNYSLESINQTRNFTVLNDADIRINSSSLNESTIFTGNYVEAATLIDNIGEVNGSDRLNISLNKEKMLDTGNVPPGEKNVSENFRPKESGEYNLTVNETNYDNLTVKKPEVNLSHPEFNVSEPGLIEINFTLNNTDPGFVNETVPVTVNESNEKTGTFSLRPEQNISASILLDWNETGFYTLELNDSEIGNFSLDHYAEFSDLSPDESSYEEGDSVELSGDVNSVGSPNITVEAGSEEFETNTSSGLTNFSFPNAFDPGNYDWSANASFNNSSFQSDTLSFEVQEEEEESSGGGSGSSGSSRGVSFGGAPAPEPELEVEESDDSIRIDAPEGQYSVEFNDSSLPIRSLDFEASESGTANFTSTSIQHSGSMESVFNIETDLEGPFTVETELSRQWLEDNKFNQTQASLFHYEDGWTDLEPQSEQEQGHIIYTKELESFSTFGLGSDQSCYSMEEVDAVVNGSCRTYESSCDVPENVEIVQSCSLFEREQDIEKKIEDAKSDGSVDQQKVNDAEEAFRTGNFKRAEEILEESQSNSRMPDIGIGSFNLLYMAVPAGFIVLLWLFIVFRPYYRRKRLISRIIALTEEAKQDAQNGEDFQQFANMVARADEALLKENYDEAEKIISDAEKMN